jgi:Ion channel
MLAKETKMIASWSERHRRLVGRVELVLVATIVVDLLGATAMYLLEHGSHSPQNEIHSFGNAFFFSTVQILTVSSQMPNPVTPWGRVVDVLLEIWAVIVVAGSAGAIASFFQEDPRTSGSS